MPVLLLFGDNILEIDDVVRSTRLPFAGADVLTLDGPSVPLPSLAEACLTAGLFDPERLVMVRALHQRFKGVRKEGGDLEEVRRILQAVPPSTTLLLVEHNMAHDHALLQAVQEAGGEVRGFITPRKSDLPRWIATRGKTHGVVVEAAAAELLAEHVGGNALAIESELVKLVTYAGDEQRITPAMVHELVGVVPQDSIFALVDAIAAGDQRQALHLVHEQLDRASANPIDFALYLIRMVARQIRILLRIRLGREGGKSSSQITTDLKLPRYYADRYFKQAARLSKERLCASFERLAAFEHGLKTGTSDPATGLDLLVAEMCV